MSNSLHVVGIQADLIWENPTKNIAFLESKINTLAADVDLIVLPEMFNTGFTMNAPKVAEKMEGFTVTWMHKIAQEKQTAICGSLVISENENYYNRMVFIHPSGTIKTYDKRHSFRLAGENKIYTAGTEKRIITYKGWKICPLICYDLRFPIWARNIENYDLLIFMANWPSKRIKAWKTLLKARAIENMCYTIGVNRTGKDANEYEYSGDSIIVDFFGDTLSELETHKTGFVSAKIDQKKVKKTRDKLGFLNDMDTFHLLN